MCRVRFVPETAGIVSGLYQGRALNAVVSEALYLAEKDAVGKVLDFGLLRRDVLEADRVPDLVPALAPNLPPRSLRQVTGRVVT